MRGSTQSGMEDAIMKRTLTSQRQELEPQQTQYLRNLWLLDHDIEEDEGSPQRTALAGFMDRDLAALSRRRTLAVPPARRKNHKENQGCLAQSLARQKSPVDERRKQESEKDEDEDNDEEFIISDVPTGLRSQRETLSALQKENFSLKLSLHSHRKQESIQNARLELTFSALEEAESKKIAMEEKLKAFKGEIVTRHRELERLISGQLSNEKEEEGEEEEPQRGRTLTRAPLQGIAGSKHYDPKPGTSNSQASRQTPTRALHPLNYSYVRSKYHPMENSTQIGSRKGDSTSVSCDPHSIAPDQQTVNARKPTWRRVTSPSVLAELPTTQESDASLWDQHEAIDNIDKASCQTRRGSDSSITSNWSFVQPKNHDNRAASLSRPVPSQNPKVAKSDLGVKGRGCKAWSRLLSKVFCLVRVGSNADDKQMSHEEKSWAGTRLRNQKHEPNKAHRCKKLPTEKKDSSTRRVQLRSGHLIKRIACHSWRK